MQRELMAASIFFHKIDTQIRQELRPKTCTCIKILKYCTLQSMMDYRKWAHALGPATNGVPQPYINIYI